MPNINLYVKLETDYSSSWELTHGQVPTYRLSDLSEAIVDASRYWPYYHTIRREELFEARGKSGYNSHHPDEEKEGNHPLIFIADGNPIGTVRLDMLSSTVIKIAAVRMFAITRRRQGEGHGRALHDRLEWFAFSEGVSLLVINAAKSAVDFYSKLGYLPSAWQDSSTGLGDEVFQMAKLIQPSKIIGRV